MKALKTFVIVIVMAMIAGLLFGTACDSVGAEGEPGVGIESTVDNLNGTFTLNFTDGTSFTTTNLTGPQGELGIQGDKGDIGDTGSQGEQGLQGEPGPNMIVAMGTIDSDGNIMSGYNITSCTYDNVNFRYILTLTGINYSRLGYVTIVTTSDSIYGTENAYCSDNGAGKLTVHIEDADYFYKRSFSFVVLAVP